MSSCSIRKASEEDAPSLSRICLLTSDAGKSGVNLHNYPELPGLLFAVPYVKLPFTFSFVMVADDTKEVVGYLVGASDTRKFERAANEEWWPALQQRYPTQGPNKIRGTAVDEKYARLMSNMSATEECIRFSPAHLHIDMLEEYQRKGNIVSTFFYRIVINWNLAFQKRVWEKTDWTGGGIS
jgi:hypothetical protein